jgi:proteic killer suppression protein
MIASFRHRGLRLLFERDDRSGVRPDQAAKIARILLTLNRARSPQDLALPGFCLHPLKGNLAGFWAVSVSGNWRIIFRFEGGDARDVDLIDYH